MCDPPGSFPTEVSFMQRHSPAEAPSSAVVQRPPAGQKAAAAAAVAAAAAAVVEARRSSPTDSVASSQSQAVTPSRQLSDAEKLKKCILELVETERTYVKVMPKLLNS